MSPPMQKSPYSRLKIPPLTRVKGRSMLPRRRPRLLRGRDLQEFIEMKRESLSTQAISELTGYDRKTVRKYLLKPEPPPSYSPRAAAPSKLEPHTAYLEDRLKAGVWNAQLLLRELRQQGYPGGYTILKDWLQPQRAAGKTSEVFCQTSATENFLKPATVFHCVFTGWCGPGVRRRASAC